MYLSNKYTKWYNNIIVNARARDLPKQPGTEVHHILPKCMGGTNSKDNLVRLWAREHFCLHMLLVKMLQDPILKRKMQFALNSFRRTSQNQQRHKLTARQYEIIRRQVSEARSSSLIGNKFGVGRIVSAETRLKMSNSMRGKNTRPMSEETKQKISSANKNRVLSEETKNRMSLARKGKPTGRKGLPGKPLSEETKRKISLAHLRRNKAIS